MTSLLEYPRLAERRQGECGVANERSGNPTFEEVAETYSAPLRRYLERMARDPAAADDLLQETLIRIARGLPAFEGRSSLKTWAFTIATRVATDHFRRPSSRLPTVDLELTGEVSDEDVDIEGRLVIDEMNTCVREIIDGLPPDYRAALVLHDLQGLTAAEIAESCDCTVATAKIRIHRARAKLRKALDGACVFYRDENDVFRCDRKDPDEDPTSGGGEGGSG